MNKFLKRDIATSLTTFLFVVIAITGSLMFFHILDNYTKDLHEILGLAFIAIVFFHVFFNWKSMKSYFTKKTFLFSGMLILLVSFGFIFNAPKGDNPKRTIIDSVLNAPIKDSLLLLNTNLKDAKEKLEKEGIKIGKAISFEEIANQNKTSPFRIVGIITKK
jgi:hypothetical protein